MLATQNAGEAVEQQELSFVADGKAEWYSHLEDVLAVSYKIKYTLTIWSSNHALWYLPKGVENLCPHKNLHMDVYSSFIHNCQNLEATKMSSSVGEWINKLWYIHTMDYYSGLKYLSSYEKTWRELKCILLSERSQSWKGYILQDSKQYDILEKAKLWR